MKSDTSAPRLVALRSHLLSAVRVAARWHWTSERDPLLCPRWVGISRMWSWYSGLQGCCPWPPWSGSCPYSSLTLSRLVTWSHLKTSGLLVPRKLVYCFDLHPNWTACLSGGVWLSLFSPVFLLKRIETKNCFACMTQGCFFPRVSLTGALFLARARKSTRSQAIPLNKVDGKQLSQQTCASCPWGIEKMEVCLDLAANTRKFEFLSAEKWFPNGWSQASIINVTTHRKSELNKQKIDLIR